jgi:hypothetical protein
MKSYTDLEQSKKLTEILPRESADMEYMFLKRDGSKVSNVPFVKDGFEEPECCYTFIPCWSLAALLGVLPSATLDSSNDHYYRLNCMERYIQWYDSPIDACYEMIIRLHELNLL